MKEILHVDLQNEMDLILANKQTMKLVELCGLSLTAQTVFATAVSEISRGALSKGNKSYLKLWIFTMPVLNKKQLVAVIYFGNEIALNKDAILLAKRLVDDVRIQETGSTFYVQLYLDLKFPGLITDKKIESITGHFKLEPPLSPYDEIRRKNIELLAYADKLQESENQYRALADNLPLMMFVSDPNGSIIYSNQRLRDYFGDQLKTMAPNTGQEVIHPDDLEDVNREWTKLFKLEIPFQASCRLKQVKNGAYRWHHVSVVPVKDENNRVTQWTGFLADINSEKLLDEILKANAELKRAQETLYSYQQRLEEKISELKISNHELEQFAYIASHDLQEPLRKIVTFSNLLKEKLPDMTPGADAYLGKIVASSLRMTDLINDVLDWSKIARSKETFTAVDLNAILEEVKNDFEFLIQDRHATVESTHLPCIHGIKIQMSQLFSNLISNALKFSREQPDIRIRARNADLQEIRKKPRLDHACAYVEITVSDNGIGFEEKYSEQIFKIFQRLNSRSEYSGTGIGLAICRKIVENHGGLITATSGPGQGATFTIILPGELQAAGHKENKDDSLIAERLANINTVSP